MTPLQCLNRWIKWRVQQLNDQWSVLQYMLDDHPKVVILNWRSSNHCLERLCTLVSTFTFALCSLVYVSHSTNSKAALDILGRLSSYSLFWSCLKKFSLTIGGGGRVCMVGNALDSEHLVEVIHGKLTAVTNKSFWWYQVATRKYWLPVTETAPSVTCSRWLANSAMHICKVVKPWRIFLSQIIKLSTLAKQLDHHIGWTTHSRHIWSGGMPALHSGMVNPFCGMKKLPQF